MDPEFCGDIEGLVRELLDMKKSEESEEKIEQRHTLNQDDYDEDPEAK